MLIWIHHYWILIINNLNAIQFSSTLEYLVALVQNQGNGSVALWVDAKRVWSYGLSEGNSSKSQLQSELE
jgi:hypothetical protein